jgi:hypothetical protein
MEVGRVKGERRFSVLSRWLAFPAQWPQSSLYCSVYTAQHHLDHLESCLLSNDPVASLEIKSLFNAPICQHFMREDPYRIFIC